MGAVASFVSDVVESVVDTVGDVVETVADVVVDAVEFVGDTVQAVIEDPIPTILSIAGAAVGIPPPVTMAAVTAARGGDLEDIVLAAGTAYIAPQATSAISSTLSSSIGNAIINETVSDIVIDGVSKGLVNGTIAEVRGGDFTDGFAGAFTGSIVNSSVGEFTNEFIKPEIQDMMADTGLDSKLINTVVNEGTRAISSGLTAEITGRGDFEDAFINSVQNSTINAGTNYAVNTIGDQFKNAETGWAKVEEESEQEDDRDLLDFDEYFALDTTRDMDTTGAGIPDDMVEEVEVAETGEDTGSFAQTSTENLEDEYLRTAGAGQFDEVLTSADEIINEISPVAEAPTEEEFDYSSFDFDSLPQDLKDLFDFGETTVASTGEEQPIGGLTYIDEQLDPRIGESDILYSAGEAEYAPEEGVISSNLYAETPEEKAEDRDIYGGLAQETFGMPTSPDIDVAEADIAADDGTGIQDLIEGGLNKLQQGFVDATDPEALKNAAVTGALQQVVRPAIRQGLTRAIKGTPSRPVARAPQPKKPLTPQQITQLRASQTAQKQQTTPKKIDMNKILAQIKKPQQYVPPKKVDVSKLKPVTDVASLTSILGGGKG